MSCAALLYEPATPASLHLNSLDAYRVARQFTHTTIQARNFMRFACAALETVFPCRRGVPVTYVQVGNALLGQSPVLHVESAMLMFV